MLTPGLSTFRLVAPPVERQRRGVEQAEPEGPELRVGGRDLEPGAAELERVAALLHGDVRVRQRLAGEGGEGDDGAHAPVLDGHGFLSWVG